MAGRAVFDVQVEEHRLVKLVAVKGVVPRGETHFAWDRMMGRKRCQPPQLDEVKWLVKVVNCLSL